MASSKTSMFVILLLTTMSVMTFTTGPVSAAKPANFSCDVKNNEKIDIYMARLITLGEYGRKYPENSKQLKPYCDESSTMANYFDQYRKKCFKGTLKQFASLFIFSVRNSLKQFCFKNNRRINDLYKAAACINQNRKQVNQCMSKLTNNFIGIKYADDKKKIPFVCCEYVGLIDCLVQVFEKSNNCRDKLDVALDFMRNLMGNLIDTSCGEYNEESDKCTSLGKPPKKRSTDKPVKSILYPLYEIIDSLPDN